MRRVAIYAIIIITFIGCCTAYGSEINDTLSVHLGEVSVTAAKNGVGPLRLQPVASTIVTATEAERLNVMTMKDVSEIAPNFYIPDYGSRMTSTVYMRGIGARIDQPVVGLNVDNVPFLNKDNYDFDVVDISRIEVLRGPQSTLYGRNTMGGQINIYTLSPLTYNGFRAMAEFGSRLTSRGSLSYYTSLADNAGTSISASYTYSAGSFINNHDGLRTAGERACNIRWKTDWELSPRLMLQNTASFTLNRQNGYPYEFIETGEINYNDPCYYHRWSFSDGLTLKYAAENFSVQSITSIQYLDDDMTLDQDFLPLSYFTLTQQRKEVAVTQDFIASGAKGAYSWLGGVFAFYKGHDMFAPVTFKDYGIEQLIVSHRNDANPYYPIVWCDGEFPLNSDFTSKVWGIAAYHQSSVRFGPWKADASLRLDYEHNSLSYRSYCSTAYDVIDASTGDIYLHSPVDIDDTGTLSRGFTQLLPKISLSYTFGEDKPSIAYLSIAKGYKAGGFNTQMFSDVLQQRIMGLMGLSMTYDIDEIISYKPEQSWNYEIGTSVAIGNVMLDAAAFYIDCRDQQLTMFPDGSTTGRIMTNAGRTRSVGAELSGSWKPSAAWLVNASYGYCDARFVKFNNGKQSYDGNRVPYAPSNTFFAGVTYTLPLRNRDARIIFNLNARGVGDIAWDEANTVYQPFYIIAGASATCEVSNLSLKIWGENLTDTRYATFYFVSIGNSFLQRGKPMQAGLTLRYNI